MLQQILSNTLAFLFAVGIIIFVHEAGHYVVAKLCGVRVLTFSLGFGRRLWGFRRGDTDYRVSLIPLGGYVAFAGQDPTEPNHRADDYLAQPRWQRVLILLAGPMMNLLLAVGLVAAVYMAGTQIVNQRDLDTEIGFVAEGSPAEQAGLVAGDRIVSIDGESVSDWQQVSMTIITSPGRELNVAYERDGAIVETRFTPIVLPKYELGEAGIRPASLPRIAAVVEDTPAERAGFQYADALLRVDGRAIVGVEDFTAYVGPRAGQTLEVEVERDGEPLRLEVTPEDIDGKGTIGVYISRFEFQKLGPVEALRESVRYNIDTTKEIGAFLGKIFERRISAQSAIGGPIQIASFSGAAARSGMRELAFFMAMISLNLALLNMLPIPILDGGQILILLVESTLRRDLSLQMKERLMQVGLVVIVSLMAMAIYFDLSKSLAPVQEMPSGELPGGEAQEP